MNDHQTEHLAHLLKRLSAIEPEAGAIEEALDRTRDALTDASTTGGRVQTCDVHRHAWRVSRWPVAVAIVVMIALGLAGSLIFSNCWSQNAFAQVQAALERVPSVSFSVHWVKALEGCDTRKTKTVSVMTRSRVRWETVDGEEISIYDAKRGIWLQLFPRQKRAILMTGMQRHDQSPGFGELFAELRKAKSNCVERLPDAELDGRKVERYRIPPDSPLGEGTESLLFVDPQTKLPVRSEAIGRDNDGRVIIRAVLTDISFAPCDASLFELVPPEGYHLEKAEATEAALSSPFAEIVPLPATSTPVEIEFRLAESTARPGLTEALVGKTPQKVYLHPEPVITRRDIETARLVKHRTFGIAIELTFTAKGSDRMAEATSKNRNKLLALLVNGRVVNAPRILATISKSARVQSDFTLEEASDIVCGLHLAEEEPRP